MTINMPIIRRLFIFNICYDFKFYLKIRQSSYFVSIDDTHKERYKVFFCLVQD